MTKFANSGTGIVPLAVIFITDDTVFLRRRDNKILGEINTITLAQAGELVLAALAQLHYVTSSHHPDGTLIEIVAAQELVAYAKSKGWQGAQ